MPNIITYAPFDVDNDGWFITTFVLRQVIQFNASGLGYPLKSIDFSWQWNCDCHRRAENLSASQNHASWGPNGDRVGLKVSTTQATPFLLTEIQGPDFPGLSVPLGAYDGVTNFTGASGTGEQVNPPANTFVSVPFTAQPGRAYDVYPPATGHGPHLELTPGLYSYFVGTGYAELKIEFVDYSITNHDGVVILVDDQKYAYGAVKVVYTY